jgi:hypothetical protein
VTEGDWVNAKDPRPMLTFLRDSGNVSERKLRLLAVACCRRVWPLIKESKCRTAVDVAEGFAVGAVSAEELTAAYEEADDVISWLRDTASAEEAAFAAFQAAGVDLDVRILAEAAANAVAYSAGCEKNGSTSPPADVAAFEAAEAAELSAQADLVRCIFGNPLRAKPAIDPSWLAWNDSIVQRLAQGIYDERAFERMPVLGDALEEAGCLDHEVLAHSRSPGPHARGCWLVDVLTGRA